MADQRALDERIQAYYGGVFDEDARLTSRSAQGPLEFRRVQELVSSVLEPQSRVLDIGGGAGVHAVALGELGHTMTLVDPVPQHVDAAAAHGIDASVADARSLPFPDASFDAALMLGPLYHLADAADRRRALDEAVRVVRPGGVVFAGAILRYIAFAQIYLTRDPAEGDPAEWVRLLRDGTPSERLRFPAGHFHTAESLERELTAAGLINVTVHGVEGPAGLHLEGVPPDADAHLQAAAHRLAEAASSVPGIRDFSGHLLAIARRPGAGEVIQPGEA